MRNNHTNLPIEPAHEIMALFVLRKLNLQWHMHNHPVGARCLIFDRTLRLPPYFMCANSEGSGETARMLRLAWAFAGRLCDKYHNLMSWLNLGFYFQGSESVYFYLTSRWPALVSNRRYCSGIGERGGSVVECRTPEREVRGSKPTAAVLCPWARHFTPRKYWLITQEAMAPSRHDWKIVDWDVKPQHNQPMFWYRHSRIDDSLPWQTRLLNWLSLDGPLYPTGLSILADGSPPL